MIATGGQVTALGLAVSVALGAGTRLATVNRSRMSINCRQVRSTHPRQWVADLSVRPIID